ncbi:MAG: hypothetical protein KIT31_28285, partial [Deltaproteobacteria bacterium]|nr:hypothetical protein [Deltaproteobacteria bacterium]
MAGLEIAALTHAGRVRPSNEDCAVVDAARGLAVVADGMGGERGGERAATTGARRGDQLRGIIGVRLGDPGRAPVGAEEAIEERLLHRIAVV